MEFFWQNIPFFCILLCIASASFTSVLPRRAARAVCMLVITAVIAMSALLKKIDKNYKNNPDIKWNFTKFAVDRDGNVVARFEPTEDMKKVDKFVEGLL